MSLGILVLIAYPGLSVFATRFSHQQHVAFEDSLQNSTQAVKSLLSTAHNSSAVVDKSRRSAVVQELLGILADEMQNKEPLEKFLPVCLAHLDKLIATMDRAYTDVQLQFMLEHECWLVKTFPHAYSHGFESHRACKCFSEKLAAARMWELADGSKERYTEFCTAYFKDPNAEGIEECAGELPPRFPGASPSAGPLPLAKDAPLGKAQDVPLGKAKPCDEAEKAVKAVPGEQPKKVASVKGAVPTEEPTVEPPFAIPSGGEIDDKEIEDQMKKMQDKIDSDISEAKKVSAKDGELTKGKPSNRKKVMRNGQEVECPFKSGSYEWCDYIIDGEPTLDKKNKAWDSESKATEIAKEVKEDTLVGDGPEPHVLDAGAPLSPESKKRMEEARKRNLAKQASNEGSQEQYERMTNHWKTMATRSKHKAESIEAAKERYHTQWERMKQATEKKKLRKQAEKEVEKEFYREKSWPWPKEEAEWETTEVRQKPRKPSDKLANEEYPSVHSLAACAVSPLVLLVGILLVGQP